MWANDKTKAGLAIVWNSSFDGTWSWLVAGKTGTAKTGLLAMDAAMEASKEGPTDNDLPALRDELINEAQRQRNRVRKDDVWDNTMSDTMTALVSVVEQAMKRTKQ